jgi:DNA invertase Pin-like site-specific DNA recombinase
MQIKEYLEYFNKNEVKVKILDLPTTMQEYSEGQEWVLEMVNNIILEVYTSIAEQERATILQRQREGIAVAKARGVHLGRPRLELPKEWTKLYKRWKNGEIKAVEFMDMIDMKKPTFYKKVKEYERTL